MDELEKITRERRAYRDACAAAHALDLIGERWSLLVMRELMLGPRRFTDLRDGLPGVSANVLTQRLGDLEAAGVVRRRRLPPPAAAAVYELTEWGLEAEPILRVMGRWAARSPHHDPAMPISAASVVLSLRTMFAAQTETNLSIRIALRMSEETYLLAIDGGSLAIDRCRERIEAPAVLEGEPGSVAAFIYGGIPLSELEKRDALRVAGEREQVERLPPLFPLPPKAPGPVQPGKS